MSDFDILAAAICDHGILVLSLNHNRHTLLRLADCKFCRIKTVIFYRHSVEIYVKSVSKFTDSHTDSTGTEVIRFLDESCNLRTTEKPLEFSFLRSITLLNLASASLERLLCVFL